MTRTLLTAALLLSLPGAALAADRSVVAGGQALSIEMDTPMRVAGGFAAGEGFEVAVNDLMDASFGASLADLESDPTAPIEPSAMEEAFAAYEEHFSWTLEDSWGEESTAMAVPAAVDLLVIPAASPRSDQSWLLEHLAGYPTDLAATHVGASSDGAAVVIMASESEELLLAILTVATAVDWQSVNGETGAVGHAAEVAVNGQSLPCASYDGGQAQDQAADTCTSRRCR